MNKLIGPILLVALTLAVTGCSTFNKLTGSTDNTVLPGTREDAIPGRSQFPDASDAAPTLPQPGEQATGQQTAPAATSQQPNCKPDDKACQPASGGTFNDPQ